MIQWCVILPYISWQPTYFIVVKSVSSGYIRDVLALAGKMSLKSSLAFFVYIDSRY
jgi:hypothetical protein